MSRFEDLSIRAKLIRTTLLATGVALLLASVAFVVFDLVTYRASIARRLSAVAQILGENSAAAILFEDRASAVRTLAALRSEPHVVSAALYRADGRLFASYPGNGASRSQTVPPLAGPGVRYPRGGLLVTEPIAVSGSRVGTVVIASDLEELAIRLRRYALIVAFVSLASLGLAWVVGSRLQRQISGPILSLAATAQAVSTEEDYSVRASGGGHDETGLLIATFNEMLERIERRDAELVEARAELERRVSERTSELTRELAERRRTEAELRRNQELLAEAQAMAKVASWEWDLEEGAVWWSDEHYRLWGVDPKAFRPTPESVKERLHEPDREKLLEALRHASRTGEPFSLEHRVVLPDGRVRLFHAEGETVRDARGKVVRVRGLEQDVTEQRQAEEERSRLVREQALREEAEVARRRSAFVAQVASVLASSLDFTRTVSAAARLAVPEYADWALVDSVEATGELRRVALAHRDRSDEELAPLRQMALSADSDCPNARALRSGRSVLTAASESCSDEEHERMRDALGRGWQVSVPFFLKGRPAGVLVWSRREPPYDASDVLLAEEVARRAATALEHATLFFDAQQANRLKDEFLATLSHELRTPLHAIVGWAHMLKTGTLDREKTRRAIESIDRNAQAQHQLISDVLDVSRIVAGKLRLNFREVDVRSVVDSALDTVRPSAETRRAQRHAELPQEPATILGDAGRLQQVVWNLLNNAVKFVPEGGSVTISLTTGEGEAQLSVTDDGPGIRPDFLPHVFERFRQGDSSSTRPHGGLGLGLAIVRHIVELHGGSVEAKNRADRSGAVFTVRLPLRPAPAPRPLDPARLTGELAQAPDAATLAGLDVLLVEDEPDSREIVATALELHGAHVRLAASAREGLEELRRRRPDVLLSDLEMPGLDGYELLRQVRQLPAESGGDVLAAALTAYAGPEHRTRALEAGFQMHIGKPVQPSELAAAVAALARRRVARPDGSSGAPARVLVVDDNPDVAESLQLLLASPRREVVTAPDGPSALESASRMRPDVVLLDLGLPGIDGYEVARRLRAMPELASVRIVALSGFAGAAEREKTQAAGFDHHLVKPADPAALMALVDSLAASRAPAPN